MDKTMNDYVAIYKAEQERGDVQIAYMMLVKYVLELKARFLAAAPGRYKAGNVSPGYMDFTYFSFFDEELRERKLRFGIVLNHHEVRFELWLIGQNADVQRMYWERLKDTKWNRNRQAMPKYSVLETTLVDAPDFNDLDALSAKIIKAAMEQVAEIMPYIV